MRTTQPPHAAETVTRKLLLVTEVADILRCSVSTVYALLETGRLVGHRCPGWRVSEEDLHAYLDETRQERAAGRAPNRRPAAPRLKNFSL